MIQIFTYSTNNNIDQHAFPYSEDQLSLKLALLDTDNLINETEIVATINQAAQCLPTYSTSPSNACIEAILAFSQQKNVS